MGGLWAVGWQAAERAGRWAGGGPMGIVCDVFAIAVANGHIVFAAGIPGVRTRIWSLVTSTKMRCCMAADMHVR